MDLWVEEFRPKKFEEVVGLNVEIPNSISKNNCMHMLLYGNPGTGKSATSKIIINKLGAGNKQDHLEFNSSKERGIDIIRDKISQFVKTKSSYGGPKVCFLDEADGMCLTEDTKVIVGTIKNPRIVKIKDLPKLKNSDNYNIGKKINIPSYDFKNKKIVNDVGHLVDSGETDFYEVELEDGRIIKASANHPFFNKLEKEVKLKDLNVGDSIIDLRDNFFNKCPICNKFILPMRKSCSRKCADKIHSLDMIGEKNHRFGKVSWNKGKTIKDDIRILKQVHKGKDNGNHKSNGGKNHSNFQIWKDGSKEQIKIAKNKLSEAHKGKVYDDYNRAIRSKYGIKGFKNSNYRRYLPKTKYVNCKICEDKFLTKGASKNSIYVHHIDKNHENNKRDNLMFVCSKCHNTICHYDERKSNKNFLNKVNLEHLKKYRGMLNEVSEN